MVRVTLLFAAVLVFGCGGSHRPDGGTGGGSGGGAAGGGSGGGAGGGGGGSGGGGVTGECALQLDSCDAGHCYQVRQGSGAVTQCLAGACDVVAQDCAAAGTKCAYGVDGGRDCYPDGTLDVGAACGGAVTADCKKGLTCVNGPLDDGGTGLACAAFCRSDGDCSGGRRCYINLDVGGPELPMVCAAPPPSCDLFAQTCTASGDGCYPTTNGPECYPAGSVGVDGTCIYANDCAPRMTCAKKSGVSGGTTCHLLCATDGGQPYCPDGGVCGTLTGLNGLGACF